MCNENDFVIVLSKGRRARSSMLCWELELVFQWPIRPSSEMSILYNQIWIKGGRARHLCWQVSPTSGFGPQWTCLASLPAGSGDEVCLKALHDIFLATELRSQTA